MTDSGGNVALFKLAQASGHILPFAPARAVDGSLNPVNRWVCGTVPCWLSVDFGKQYWINRWVLRHMASSGWPANYVMPNYKLQGSNDGANWHDIDNVTGNTISITNRTFAPQYVRFVRVFVQSGLTCNPQLASICELEVYEIPDSPYLSNLTISSGTLTPAFSSGVFSYTATVLNDIASISLTPTAVDTRATIKVNNTPVVSGSSISVDLVVGQNPINIEVTSFLGVKQVYSLVVTRAKSPYLANLTLSSGTLNPNFNKNTNSYTSSVPNAVSEITVTPVAEDPTAQIRVSGAQVPSGQPSQRITLNVGTTSIRIQVAASDGLSNSLYMVAVTRAGS